MRKWMRRRGVRNGMWLVGGIVAGLVAGKMLDGQAMKRLRR